MSKKTALTELEKEKLVADIFPKGGRPRLTAALAEVRELNGKLTESVCREVALHASKQELKEEISRLNKQLKELLVEGFKKDTQLERYTGWVYNTEQLDNTIKQLKAELVEQTARADNLYDANQKFAFDDNAYRLEAVAAQNQLTNDNLYLSDEVDRLNKLIRSGAANNHRLSVDVENLKAERDNACRRQVKCWNKLLESREETKTVKTHLACWIANPVNKELDEQVKHLTDQNRTLFIQAGEFKNQRDQLLDANAGLARDIERQSSVITRLRGTVNSFKAAYVEAKDGYEKLRAGTLKTNEIFNKEIAKERNKHDIRLVGAKQRITELESALNYFNGLYQQGEPGLIRQLQEQSNKLGVRSGELDVENAKLRSELLDTESALRKCRDNSDHLNALLDCKVRANFDLSEKLSELIKASSRTPFHKLWTRWINKV